MRNKKRLRCRICKERVTLLDIKQGDKIIFRCPNCLSEFKKMAKVLKELFCKYCNKKTKHYRYSTRYLKCKECKNKFSTFKKQKKIILK